MKEFLIGRKERFEIREADRARRKLLKGPKVTDRMVLHYRNTIDYDLASALTSFTFAGMELIASVATAINPNSTVDLIKNLTIDNQIFGWINLNNLTTQQEAIGFGIAAGVNVLCGFYGLFLAKKSKILSVEAQDIAIMQAYRNRKRRA